MLCEICNQYKANFKYSVVLFHFCLYFLTISTAISSEFPKHKKMEESTTTFYTDHRDYDYYSYYDNDRGSMINMEAGKSTFALFSVVCNCLIICVPGNGFLFWVLLKERDNKTTYGFFLLQLTTSDLASL